MHKRGFFSVFFLLLLTIARPGLAGFSGEITGSLGSEGMHQRLSVLYQQSRKWCDLALGFDVEYDSAAAWQGQSRWHLQAGALTMNHNHEHYTSADVFRLIAKNNFASTSYYFGLHTSQFSGGYLRQVPLRALDIVDAVFCESRLELGPLALLGLQLQFAGITESGFAQVLQAQGQLGAWEAVLALGQQTDSRGEASRAIVGEVKRTGSTLTGSLLWQVIDPDFDSPLAKSNRFAPNRQGWQLQLQSSYRELEVGFNIRRHSNREETRQYNQLSLKLAGLDGNASCEWRLEPTKALIFRYSEGDILVQLDPINKTFRYDTTFGDVFCGFRFEAERLIGRLELKVMKVLEWRWIGKYDFQQRCSHCSFLVRGNLPGGFLQLEIGQYDRGNMGAGFNNSGSVCISWGWKF